MKIEVRKEDFDVGTEVKALENNPKAGAIVTFIGTVRDISGGQPVEEMELEYYPEMTEKSLEKIVQEAKSRWEISDVIVIHRVGNFKVTDQIVFVGVSSPHRAEAFDACEFIMDYLKVDAPFWKKEIINGEG